MNNIIFILKKCAYTFGRAKPKGKFRTKEQIDQAKQMNQTKDNNIEQFENYLGPQLMAEIDKYLSNFKDTDMEKLMNKLQEDGDIEGTQLNKIQKQFNKHMQTMAGQNNDVELIKEFMGASDIIKNDDNDNDNDDNNNKS